MAITRYPSETITTKSQIVDYAGKQASATFFNELLTGNKEADVSVQFQYNLATSDVTTVTVDTGTATQADSRAVVSSGTGTSAEVQLQSVNSLIYKPGHEAFSMFSIEWTTGGLADSTQFIGSFDDNNGFFLGFNGVDFSFGLRSATSDTITAQSNFNQDKLDGSGPSGFTLDATKFNVFRITFGWLGISPVLGEIYGGFTNGWIPFHVFDLNNIQTAVSIQNPVLPTRVEIIKSTAGATNLQMKSGSWSAGVNNSGKKRLGVRYFHTDNEDKSITGDVLTNVFTVKNTLTFQGKINRVFAGFHDISIAVDGTKNVKWSIIKNAAVAGSPSFTNIDSVNSIMSVDVDGTTVSGGVGEATFFISKTGDLTRDITDMTIEMLPGDTLTLAALSINNSVVDGSLRWGEHF